MCFRFLPLAACTPHSSTRNARESIYTRPMNTLRGAWLLGIGMLIACGGDNPVVEQTSQSCDIASQCYPKIDAATLQGAPVCLDRVPSGYCTHLCVEDSDCCAVSGECSTGHPQVCAPFESTGMKYCFLSCEADIVSQAKLEDDKAYCSKYANESFGCRSTGGGSENRKVCMP